MHGRKVSVTGLGYVGLPVAVAFGRLGRVVGFDSSAERIAELKSGRDRTGEIPPGALREADIVFTSDPSELSSADFHIVTVPTPVDAERRPDLEPLRRASATLGAILRQGDIVVYESTVYPGATEEFCVPILEQASGLRNGKGFFTGYSPERINPGDAAHRLESITKVVAGCDERTTGIMEGVYGSVITAGIHRAPSIRVAEAAKVIENTQRDLNIALMNELALICERLDIDTDDVLRAAATKWNFLPFTPGLVGGHCIGVDPYYLTHKAMSVGYTPRVILAGRSINDGMAVFVAGRALRAMSESGIEPKGATITVLGLTFKEDIPDVRNTAVVPLLRELARNGARVQVHDPHADPELSRTHYGVELVEFRKLEPAQALVIAVAHAEFRRQGWALARNLLASGRGVVFDVKGILDRSSVPEGIHLLRL
jgi:UDP-N-acetyl-D-galactosamine dehydrogenase